MGWPVLPEKEVSKSEFMEWPTLPEGANEDEDISSPLRFRLIIGGVSIVIMLVILVFSYFYTREQSQTRDTKEQAQTQVQRENQDQKEGQIARLRDRIAEIRKRLLASDRSALKGKRDVWSESLNRLNQRLDDISKMSSDQLQEISRVCGEVAKELDKIEKEINSLIG